MEKYTVDFLSRLGRGLAVLFLGQRYLRLESGRDPLLDLVAAKFGATDVHGYDDLLTLGFAESAEGSLAWLDERCQRIATPDLMEEISEFPWSSVVTSAVDTVLAEGLPQALARDTTGPGRAVPTHGSKESIPAPLPLPLWKREPHRPWRKGTANNVRAPSAKPGGADSRTSRA